MCDIKKREVINIKDGVRLGFVNDFIFDEKTGKIEKLVVPAPSKLFGVFGSAKEYRIGWDEIKVMGEDFLMIDTDVESLLTTEK